MFSQIATTSPSDISDSEPILSLPIPIENRSESKGDKIISGFVTTP
jgi:hypothetical protein